MRRSTWHVRAGAVVVAWLVAALAAAALSMTRDMSAWLLLHLLLLGAVSNAILIWSSHFSEAMLRLPSRAGHRDETARLVLFNAGAVAVVVGMTLIDVPMTAWGVTIAGGVIVAEVVIWHAVDLIRRMRRALPSRFGSTVRYYVVASLLLPFGIYLGLLLVPDDLPESTHAQLALAHVSTNLLGWMGLTVLGTLVTLWPTMLHTQVDDTADRSARRALPVLAVGIAVLAVGALAGARPVALCGLLGYLAGVVIVGGPLVREARRRMPTTYATWSVAAALTWFVGCVVVLGVILATAPDWESAAESADRLGVPLLVGFAAQLLVGALSFLIPVVLGGGPAMARATGGLLDSAAALRVAFINAGVLIGVLPVADGLRRAAAAAVLLCFGAFLVLAVDAVVTARRVESPS